jgi:hypothetical protein
MPAFTARVFPLPRFVFKGSLVDPRLRAMFSPSQPRARRDALLPQASTF